MTGPGREQLLDILDSVAEAVLTLDAEWRITYANDQAIHRLRGERHEVLGANLWACAPSLVGTSVQEATERSMRDQTIVRHEAYIRSEDAWFQIDLYPSRDVLTVFSREITEDKRQEIRRTIRGRITDELEPFASPVETLTTVLREVRAFTGIQLGELWLLEGAGPPRLVAREHDDSPELERMLRTGEGRDWGPIALRAAALETPQVVATGDDATGDTRLAAGGIAGLRSTLHMPFPLEASGSIFVLGFWSGSGPGHDDWFRCLTDLHGWFRDLVNRQGAQHALNRVFELSRDGLVVSGTDGYFKRINPAMVHMLGWSEDDLLSKPYRAYIHPEDLDITAAKEAQVKGGHPGARFENRYLTASGTYRTLSWTAQPVPAEGMIYCVVRDVTEDVRQRDYEAFQRDLLEGIALGAPLDEILNRLAWMLEARDPELLVSVLLVDESGERVRMAAAPSLPQGWNDAVDGEPITENGSCGAALVRNEPVVTADILADPLWRIYRAAGVEYGLRACWSVPFSDREGTVLGTLGVYRRRPGPPSDEEMRLAVDASALAGIAVVTARDEAALRASEARFRLLSKATSDAVWDWDLDSGAVWWSGGLVSLFGHRPEQVDHEDKWVALIHPEDRDRVLETVATATAGEGTQWTASYRIRLQDGTYAHVEDRGSIIRDDAGTAVRIIGGMSDVTEQRRLEQQYLRAQRMESIGTLAGGIAHDLNNVLTPVVLGAELLEQSVSEDDREVVETISSAARRGTEMVRQVLTFARGAEGEHRALDPAGIVDELARIIRDSFPKDVTIRWDVQPDAWRIYGDPTQIHQVLLNLVVNARDAMPEGGDLTVAVANREVRPGTADTEDDVEAGAHVVFTISDTGTGMDPDVRRRIFEPFFTTKSADHRTGLGLPTSLAIVRSHGGQLLVDSAPGCGTTAKVYLPAHAADRPLQAGPRPEMPHGDGQTILVVDDESSVRVMTSRTLEAFGYRTVVAGDGAEALELYRSQRDEIDAVLTDSMMPGLNGAATVEALRAMDDSVRVLMVSGLADDQDTDEIVQQGPVAFLSKPYTTADLLTALRAVLSS